MIWNSIPHMFDRAAKHVFDRYQLLFTFALLLASGLVVLACQSLALHAGALVVMGLTFLPASFFASLLFTGGIILVRGYHDTVKRREVSYRNILTRSWRLMIGASYFTLPLILGYLFLWSSLGLFYLLGQIPYLGDFFTVVFVAGPFLLNIGALLLCAGSIGMLFFLTPIIALRGLHRPHIAHVLIRRLKSDFLVQAMLLIIALLPVLVSLVILHLALRLTDLTGFVSTGALQSHLQWLFLSIPYAACLAPATIFFFNFATESHVLMQQRFRQMDVIQQPFGAKRGQRPDATINSPSHGLAVRGSRADSSTAVK